jgi:hypothetical protein
VDSATVGSGLPGSCDRLLVFFDFQLHSKQLKPVGRVLDVSSAALRPICLCIKPTRLLYKSISETKAIYIVFKINLEFTGIYPILNISEAGIPTIFPACPQTKKWAIIRAEKKQFLAQKFATGVGCRNLCAQK